MSPKHPENSNLVTLDMVQKKNNGIFGPLEPIQFLGCDMEFSVSGVRMSSNRVEELRAQGEGGP